MGEYSEHNGKDNTDSLTAQPGSVDDWRRRLSVKRLQLVGNRLTVKGFGLGFVKKESNKRECADRTRSKRQSRSLQTLERLGLRH